MNKLSFAILLGLVAASGVVSAAEKLDFSKLDLSKLPPAADKTGLTYAQDIKPLLDASCVRCHGQDRPKAGLRLDSAEGILQGTHDGKVVVPGKSVQSLLVIAASQIDEHTAMPPKPRPGRGGPGFGGPGGPPPPDGGGNPPGGPSHGPQGGPRGFGPPPKPLTAEQVGLVRAWIDQGAK